MSSGRPVPIRSLVWSVMLIAVAAASVYLSYELIVKPRQALQGVRDLPEVNRRSHHHARSTAGAPLSDFIGTAIDLSAMRS